ncbi:MAG: hypothetical protein PHU49_15180 [Syntrophorhabdaceae bacterium]|nr:hypothetical protein [Syntrophorhabdaceae bacterium]
MRSFQRFYKDVNLLNIILFVAILVLVVFDVVPLFDMRVKFTLPAAKVKTAAKQEIPVASNAQTPSPSDYTLIGEDNLFHPERRTPKEEKLLPKPELVLYGTIVAEGASVAYIEDKKSPKTTPGRGKRQTAVKKGDVISGFVLREIEADRIVLTRGEETISVYLTDTGKQRGSETTLSPSKATGPDTGFYPEPATALPGSSPSKPAAAPAAAAPAPAPSTAPVIRTPPATRGRGNYKVRTPGQINTPAGQ